MYSHRKRGRSLIAWLLSTAWSLILLTALLILISSQSVQAHGGITLDGDAGDWCAPTTVATMAPDTLLIDTPAGSCALGNELIWNDWDDVNDGIGDGTAADTMGWTLGGSSPAASVSDPEVDIDYFAVTGDSSNVYFLVALGDYTNVGFRPNIQIAINVDGSTTGGNSFWYDPLNAGYGVGELGASSIGGPLSAHYIIVTDLGAGGSPIARVFEAATVPGSWTLIGATLAGWSGAGVPGIIEIGIPWSAFSPGPSIGPGNTGLFQLMTTHGGASAGVNDAPTTPPDDLITEVVAGTYTTSPDSCTAGPLTPPFNPASTDCELNIGPNGSGTADAWIATTFESPTAVELRNIESSNSGMAATWVIALPILALLTLLTFISKYRHHKLFT